MNPGDTATILREIEPDDHPALAGLFVEMQAHYRVHCPPVAEIIAGLGRRPEGSRLLLAWRGGQLAGFAAFSGLYPGPGLQPGLFLKELFVSGSHRGFGIGTLLMQRLARIAADEGYARIDWTADAGDARLQSYYASLGGTALPEKLFFRLRGAGLAALADRQDET